MRGPFHGKSVVLGVTGSIACYKGVDLASKLTQQGAAVDVVMTASATKFVSPLTFRSVSHRPVTTDMFAPDSEFGIHHVGLAERADVIVVAPATADFIAKAARGLADDALTTTMLATGAPCVIAPAMDGRMYENAATQENLGILRKRGMSIAGPACGRLASGLVGRGRLIETPELLGHIAVALAGGGDLAGLKVVVSAGGTREPIDAARHITNRSSGKMGHALAEAARDRGASVSLVTAAAKLPAPVGAALRRVGSAEEMLDALRYECADANILIMAAAVADWRPVSASGRKLKKGASREWSLELTQTPDILAELAYDGLFRVGFAAETDNLADNARTKLQAKGLDLIAANDLGAEGSGFDVDTNKITLIDRAGRVDELPLMTKYEAAHEILDRTLSLMSSA